jgi:transcriptional repressor NrdR
MPELRSQASVDSGAHTASEFKSRLRRSGSRRDLGPVYMNNPGLPKPSPPNAGSLNHMHCPFCRHSESKVVDSRISQKFAIRRRRECLSCRRRFTTYEKVEDSPLKVIKKDGSRVQFHRDSIRVGLEKACYKRPISAEKIDAIIADVEADIYENFEREVPSRYIGERVFELLRDLDQVAFVRFASVYREFKDVNDFVDELEPMLRAEPRNRTNR